MTASGVDACSRNIGRDAIMSALEEDALRAIRDDEVFDERYLARTGTLGHRVLSMLT